MQGRHKVFLVVGLVFLAVSGWQHHVRRGQTNGPVGPPEIEVWHGDSQRVGHLGDAQDDFNLLGNLVDAESFEKLVVMLNDVPLMPLTIAEGSTGFRRLARPGHFNADIPVSLLRRGTNNIVLRGIDSEGRVLSHEVTLAYEEGSCPLPFQVAWSQTSDPQAVGQYVDGEWALQNGGLRTCHTGYDRIFLLGNRSWQDYEVTTSITVHKVTDSTGPLHGGNGVGLIMRFAGHVSGGHRNFREDQPKWGYQPFGAIGWLRWRKDWTWLAPRLEYYAGDSDASERFGSYGIKAGRTYRLKMACQTLPDGPNGEGVTRYSFKVWPDSQPEPKAWQWEKVQTSLHALRQGGVGLLAHHVDVTFGDVTVTPLKAPNAHRFDHFASDTPADAESVHASPHPTEDPFQAAPEPQPSQTSQ